MEITKEMIEKELGYKIKDNFQVEPLHENGVCIGLNVKVEPKIKHESINTSITIMSTKDFQNYSTDNGINYKKFCKYQSATKEAMEVGKYDCDAHIGEARVFSCRYRNNEERLKSEYPCADYELVMETNQPAKDLLKIAQRLRRRHDKLVKEICEKERELEKICIHDETKIVDDYIEGDYYNTSQYIKKLVCTVCGKEFDKKVTRGGYG